METSPVRDPRQPPRQAVVLIHGIGEQRPMETLRGFVASLLAKGSFHSKPDLISGSYELRRLKLRRVAPDGKGHPGLNGAWPETDFFEYYWAHQMHGTRASHVRRWLLNLLGSGRHFVWHRHGYPRLHALAVCAWGMVLVPVLLAAAVYWGLGPGPWLSDPVKWVGAAGGALALVLFALRTTFNSLLDVVGDAARYFDVQPQNVARRHDILRGGVDVLRHLHDLHERQGDDVMYRYGRIVLVGHSLGSVIAYDILRHYWAQVNGQLPVARSSVAEVESFDPHNNRACFDGAKPYHRRRRFREAQHRLWQAISARVPAGVNLPLDELWHADVALRRGLHDDAGRDARPLGRPPQWLPSRWLVSDLVTLGSPLAHAPVLLAGGLRDLDRKRRRRELPTCPPDRSRHLAPGRFTVALSAELQGPYDYPILHHGAHFAMTRWTNFWFPGDPVGGPLRRPFGYGIHDERLPDGGRWPWSHTRYWAHRRRGCVPLLRHMLCNPAWPDACDGGPAPAAAVTSAPAAAPPPT